MKFHKQRFRHRPELGEFGDCHRTALACLLELEPEDIPNFGQWYDYNVHGSRFQNECAAFLASRGLKVVDVAYNCTLEDMLTTLGSLNPDAYYLLGGQSRTGLNHTVVGKGGAIIWDPSLDDAGIVGPCQPAGMYWVSYLVDLRFFEGASRPHATFTLPPLNEQLIEILGRPNFGCIRLAQALRAGGHVIKTKAEHEQAAVLHFLLGHYLKHGDRWAETAQAEIKTMLAAAVAAAPAATLSEANPEEVVKMKGGAA